MNKTITKVIVIIILIISYACNKSKLTKEQKVFESSKFEFKEKDLVLDSNYKIGDVRRYGIFTDSITSSMHPITKKNKIDTVLDLAEQTGIELFFPKGNYKTALILDGRENITIKFEMAEFDVIHITQDTTPNKRAKNITLKGTIIIYDRLGITEARNIQIDTVYIKSDIKKNNRKIRSRGCHIYHGSKYITINYLEIDDLGSGNEMHENNHAALAIDGWQNNPENVNIHKLFIKSSDRHAVYLTGKNHMINEIIINKFGIGSYKGMSGMQDAEKEESKLFSAIWINRCYSSTIGKIEINVKNSKGFYTANFDEGDSIKPIVINQLKVKNFNKKLPIHFAVNTGVIVKKTINN